MGRMKPQPIENIPAILDNLPPKYAALAALGIATGGRIQELLTLRRIDLIDPVSMELRDTIQIVKLKTRRRASINAKLDEIRASIEDAKAPRNYAGQRIDQLDKPKPTPAPPPKKYRYFTIPDELKGYIVAHLNAEARNGYIRPKQYVFRGNKPDTPMKRITAYSMFSRKLGAGFGTHWMRKTYARFMFDTFLAQFNGDTYLAVKAVQELLGHTFMDSTARYLQLDIGGRESIIRDAFKKALART